MQFSFLDEFGHIGPFNTRHGPRYNENPVFGLAGFIMPHEHVRQFATFMLKLKQWMLASEIEKAQVSANTWEKKGKDLISSRNIKKYPHIREGIERLLKEADRKRGKIFYYGREKYQSEESSNANGLYKTVLSHSIRNINAYCQMREQLFMMVLDQHSGRLQLIETSAKTMFNPESPARCMIEPPFEVESHLYQTVQAADWIATIVGRLMAYRFRPDEFSDWEWCEKYFGREIDRLATNSTMWRPSKAQRK